ncbi:uncharacterized protein LOC105251547 isoform X2 [Camponotus floridanus]|nr:uncharacterized protein LOC105251547 isoform X2 [Camponotus floridanus]
MMRFCPLCIKNGLKRKIKAFQVSFEEAVWSCEGEDCPWPIGHDEIAFFQRNALTCDWNENLPPPIGIPEESISMPMELLLYTPPVTPGELSKESTDSASTECSFNLSSENKTDEILVRNEVIYSTSTKEPIGSSPTLELSRLENYFIKEKRNSTKEENASVNVCKVLPRITNIQKTHLDVTFLSKSEECCNEEVHKDKYLNNQTTMDITENTLLNNILCKQIDSDTQCKIESEQDKNSKMQLDDEMNKTETNLNIEMLLEPDKQLFGANDINILNTNNSASNISNVSLNIDKILEDILNTENHITENINNDWLRSLMDV